MPTKSYINLKNKEVHNPVDHNGTPLYEYVRQDPINPKMDYVMKSFLTVDEVLEMHRNPLITEKPTLFFHRSQKEAEKTSRKEIKYQYRS